MIDLERPAWAPGLRLWLGCLALTVVAGGDPGASVRAEPLHLSRATQCIQPSPAGCPLGPEEPASGVLRDPDAAHQWWLTVPSAGRISLLLTDLDVDLRLYVYAPDGTLVGVSQNDGLTPESLQFDAVQQGAYGVFVDSPRGERSALPYRLVASFAPSGGPTLADPSLPPPGTVLVADDFNDPNQGWFATRQSQSGSSERGYVDGEYLIRKIGPPYSTTASAFAPGRYADASLGVDARTPDGQAGWVTIACRDSGDGFTGYRLQVDVEGRRYRLYRADGQGTRTEPIRNWSATAAIRRGGQTNRLEIHCAGTSIGAVINGQVEPTVEDGRYASGRFWIGTGVNDGVGEARFDNLVIQQR